MKTRLLCALLVALILITACVSHPKPVSQMRKDTRIPMSAGHYSLVYIPAVGVTPVIIPVTGESYAWQDFFNACNGRADKIHPRFGRSLRYSCRDK